MSNAQERAARIAGRRRTPRPSVGMFFLGCLVRVLDDTLAISDPQAMLLVLTLFLG